MTEFDIVIMLIAFGVLGVAVAGMLLLAKWVNAKYNSKS